MVTCLATLVTLWADGVTDWAEAWADGATASSHTVSTTWWFSVTVWHSV